MTGVDLARSYLRSAQRRLLVLPVLRDAGGYNDVVRESQEIVELALKALLRTIGIDPPNLHDVGGVIIQHTDRFPEAIRASLPAIAQSSRELRRNRELSFCGAPDFLPDLEFGADDASKSIAAAEQAVATARAVIGEP